MTRTRSALRLSLSALEDRCTPATAGLPPGGTGPGGGPGQFGGGLGYSFTNWPAEPLNDIVLTTENTFPLVGPRGQGVRAEPEDWLIRDPFPLTDLDGRLAQVGGWYVVAGLATPRDDADSSPNGVSTLREFRYILSRDGVNWQEGGVLISSDDDAPGGGLGGQLFSGDFRWDAANNRILIYYTPVEAASPDEYVDSPSGRQIPQEIAVAQATPVPTATGLTLTDYVQYGVKLQADGNWYAQAEFANTETEVYGFRDPYFFRDPRTGTDYLLFTANWGRDQTFGTGRTGDQEFPDAGPTSIDPELTANDGVAGIAVATDDTLTNWQLLPPLFGGIGVNTQLELPHVIFRDGLYYLYFTTHTRTFIGDLKFEYPEGFYGFVADDLQGPYRPLNGTGLIGANPPDDELQTYAWKAADLGDGRATVLSFINKFNAGTIAPSVNIRMDGDTAVLDQFQSFTGAGLPQPTVLAFGVTPTAPLDSTPPPPVPPAQVMGDAAERITVTAAGRLLVVVGADGVERFQVDPFPGFAGQVNRATGDVTGDGVADLVVGAGDGGAPHVKVFDGRTGREVASFFAYESTFRNGVNVAVGDVRGDARAEIVTGAGVGGAPRVVVFDGTGRELSSFFAYDPTFRGGVFVAVGDLQGTARAEIVTVPQRGGGPNVKVFDGETGATLQSYFDGDPSFRGGMRVELTDPDFDGTLTVSVVRIPTADDTDDEE